MSAYTARVLRDAAQYIRDHGWTKNHFTYRGRVCAYAAIDAVRGPYITSGPVFEALREVIGHDVIVEWNDRQTSRKPVLAAFERAALAEEAKS